MVQLRAVTRVMRGIFPVFLYSVIATLLCFVEASGADAERSSGGLMALYNFCESGGPLVRDVSPGGAGGTLQIQDLRRVERRDGALRIFGDAVISPLENGQRKLSRALMASNSLSLEAWITPGSLNQKGPARILTFSGNSSERNFTLGQDGSAIDVRLRTTETSRNGIPSLSTGEEAIRGGVVHVVYTRDRQGRAVIYINGSLAAEGGVGGTLDNWDDGFGLHIANESGGGRPWTGSLHLLAIYSRALSSEEVSRHFEAGPAAADSVESSVAGRSEEELFFENRVAPILANHCLECHDSATREGDLDLSRRASAFAGGKGGKVIIPGRSGESELWLTVHHDEMPDDRYPLSADQKAVIAKWIDDGARWSLDFIDPALYLSHVGVSDHHVRRLTVEEYIRSVQSAVGVDITDMARRLLPADLRADGFRNTAYNLTVDLKHIHAYSELASEIVRRMDVRDFARRFSSRLKFTDNDMGALITAMGIWIHRAPLEEHELFAYRGITTSVAASGGTYGEAVSLVIEAMLQSPRFLYRIENQIGDGTAWPVDGFEMASRISYTLWGSPPDADLLAAAEKGDLYDRQSVSGHVNRMLDDPRAIRQSLEFFRQWLNLDRLNSLNPSADHFPDWDPSLAQDMEKETLMFIEDLLWKQQRPIHQIFDGDFTWLTPRLARHYRLEASLVPDGPGQEFQKVIFPEGHPRGGLLTHGSVLTVGGDEASMVSRGLFVMIQLLRGVVKDPPPCVDTTPVPSKPGMTQRTVALERLSDGSCAGCHKKFEPLAFGLEKFDGLGSYHQMDEFGNALRDDGQILVPGAAEPVEYESSNELMGFLASSSRVEETIVWKLTQFALGRPLAYRDAPAVNAIIEKRPQRGWTWKELVRTILLSDLMKTSMTETLENE